jgi:hypothetical protein
MALIDKPIADRPGYRESNQRDALQRDLSALATKHNLFGCVLVEFTRDERVGVRSCGVTDEFCAAMTTLGSRILTDIDDGRHDPLEHLEAEGRG